MKELFNRIIAWGEPKGLYNIEYEPLSQIGFLLEELHEVNKEFIAGNTDKAIGEICDLIVYSVNAIVLLKGDFDKNFDYIELKRSDFQSILNEILHRISYISSVIPFNNGYIESGYDNLIAACYVSIKSLGYSPEVALEETILKIESRRGVYVEEIKKFVKEANQTDVYEPDYSKAKITK